MKILKESQFVFESGSVLATSTADILEENDKDMPMDITEKLSLLIYSEQYNELYKTVESDIFEKRFRYTIYSIQETFVMLSSLLQYALYRRQKNEMRDYSDIISEAKKLTVQKNIFQSMDTLKQVITSLVQTDYMEQSYNNMQTKQLKYIDEMCKIIEEKYQEHTFSSKTIASMLNLSNIYICRIFKNAKKEGLNQYINSYRIKKATELLSTTTLNAQEVAQQCGFYNVNYFYTLFKKHMGITTSEYQKKYNSPE